MLEGKMRYFLHDCRMFDTYELTTFIRNCHLVYKRNYQEILMWCRVIKNIKRLDCYLRAFLVLDTPVAARRQGKTANDIARRKLTTSRGESNMKESNSWITFLKCTVIELRFTAIGCCCKFISITRGLNAKFYQNQSIHFLDVFHYARSQDTKHDH